MEAVRWNKDWYFKTSSGGNLSSLVHGTEKRNMLVQLPHDAMIHEKRTQNTENGMQTGFYPGGFYEYCKSIDIPEKWQNKKVILEFEGVYMQARVYVNGDLAASSCNGYSNFYVDLDGFLKYGTLNEVRVTVDNSALPNSRWYSGSGIYRNVNLMVSERLHIGVNGVRIKTESASDKLAEILINTTLQNEDYHTRKIEVVTEVFDEQGNQIVSDKIPVTAYGDETVENRQRVVITKPQFWSCETPKLYTYQVRLMENGIVVDRDCGTFGIRTLNLNASTGLCLNGVETKLRGACIHHDNGVIGACTLECAEERRCRQLKEAGFNCIRSAHNPLSKAMLDACDKIGMLVIDELGDMWTHAKNRQDYSRQFMEHWEEDVKRMVEKDYNHPCVIMYCMGNELPEAGSSRGAALNRKMSNLFHKLDQTRYTTNAVNGILAASDQLEDIIQKIRKQQSKSGSSEKKSNVDNAEGSNVLNNFMSIIKGEMADAIASHPIMTECIDEFVSAMDVAGYNYMTARHTLEKELHPGRIVLGTETYSTDIVKLWNIVEKNPHVIGDMTWTGYDYIGEAGIGIYYYDGTRNFSNHWPDHLANVGDIDITGYRRPVSYLREIVFGLRKSPYIAVERLDHYGQKVSKTPWMSKDNIESWTWPGYEGKSAAVDVYSDAEEVELFVNGKSMGRKPAGKENAFTAAYEIEYQPGELKAVCYRNLKRAEEWSLNTASSNVELGTRVDNTVLRANGRDLAYIEVFLKDENGRENRYAEREVMVELKGPAVIQGVGSAVPITENSFDNPVWKTYDGRLLAVIRAGYEAGSIKVILSSKGCREQEVFLEIKEQD